MKKGNYITAVICILLALYILYTISSYPTGNSGVPGPGVFPFIMASILLVFSILLCFTKTEQKMILNTKDHGRVYISMGILIIYVLLLPFLGFILSSFILLTLLFLWFDRDRSKLKSMLISSTISLGIYLLFFKVLNVPLDFGLFYF